MRAAVAQLWQLQLRQIQFRHTELRHVDFRHAQLRHTELGQLQLRQAHRVAAGLRGTSTITSLSRHGQSRGESECQSGHSQLLH
ncbi:hypothetical protein GC176_04000 [bacterium]|nr:hypothetical protein [bacterium]